MRDLLILFVHLIVTVSRLARPGGLRSVVAESVLVRHQLLVLSRGRKRAPKLRTADRIIAGLCTLFMLRARVLRSAIVLKPSTLLHLHSVLRKRKYRMLFSPERGRRPGPKGPKKDVIDAVVAMKRPPRCLTWVALAGEGMYRAPRSARGFRAVV
jgi:putative transposase